MRRSPQEDNRQDASDQQEGFYVRDCIDLRGRVASTEKIDFVATSDFQEKKKTSTQNQTKILHPNSLHVGVRPNIAKGVCGGGPSSPHTGNIRE